MNKKLFYGVTTLIGLGIIYFTINKFFGKKNKTANSILFVGDSITVIDYNGQPVKTYYPYLIKQELEPKGKKIAVLAVA